MKHLLINPYSQPQEWCKDYFPDRSLGMMPVAGRCAAEYFIDLALRCEAEKMLLLGPPTMNIWQNTSTNTSMARCSWTTAKAVATLRSKNCCRIIMSKCRMTV